MIPGCCRFFSTTRCRRMDSESTYAPYGNTRTLETVQLRADSLETHMEAVRNAARQANLANDLGHVPCVQNPAARSKMSDHSKINN